ncbi:hypothetical protein BASA61_004019 [Batrachochytrium salamandrivorans]|nr:hypothetical protein BASA62_009298 [Batrachochytrium salamandrivorans]KAH6594482.1 hypothetical protein BASA61_004019 [Batrachochytrium salamandrivorans]
MNSTSRDGSVDSALGGMCELASTGLLYALEPAALSNSSSNNNDDLDSSEAAARAEARPETEANAAAQPDAAIHSVGPTAIDVTSSRDDAIIKPPSTPLYTGLVMSQVQREFMLDEARIQGFWPWLNAYSRYHVADLFQVFGAELPIELRTKSSEDLLPILYSIMSEKASPRKKRPDINTFEDALRLIESSNNILVLTGAGCSVSCGIPDFRSKNGIYSRLEEFELEDPQQMFDIHYFRFRPETFYSFAKEIYPSNFTPSPSHMFIKLLEMKGKLLNNYTQNIDTLEKAAGISHVVQCHGSFATASCIVCGYHAPGAEIESNIFEQTVPRCPECSEDVDGIMKPDIVFFGENLSDEFDRKFLEDRKKTDLLIVMGSSLKVSPVADVKDRIPHHVPQILINLESLPHMAQFDIQLLGYCDTIVMEICRKLGWKLPRAILPSASSDVFPEPLEAVEGSEIAPALCRPGSLVHRHLFEGAIEADKVFESDDASSADSGSTSSRGSETDDTTGSDIDVVDDTNDQDIDDAKPSCIDAHADGEDLPEVNQEWNGNGEEDVILGHSIQPELTTGMDASRKRRRSLSPSISGL